jgi:histidinol-phosphate/aromatic aminotransferase/cobyric acid decarboxylase-like protein
MPSEPLSSRPARAHGGPIAEELQQLGFAGGDVLDFSVNVNPYGPAPAMLDAIRAARVDLYPDPTAFEARAALAVACGTTAERIALGNGGADLLWTLARVLLEPGDSVMIVEPTFSEFRAAVVMAGGRTVEWRASPERAFAVDLDAVAASARACGATALYLCTPNNPTGVSVVGSDVISLAEMLPKVTLVLDQAFLSLSDDHADAALEMSSNVIRVRSLTKEHAIPGVRVGYLIATPSIAAAIEASRPAWSTSAAAQAAAVASCRLSSFVCESRDRMLADRRALLAGLREIGLAPLPTAAAFCIVPVSDAPRLRRSLLSRDRILVRDCASFGMPGHARLAARPAADCARLLAALQEELRRC